MTHPESAQGVPCRVCGRPLRGAAAIARGAGSTCASKEHQTASSSSGGRGAVPSSGSGRTPASPSSASSSSSVAPVAVSALQLQQDEDQLRAAQVDVGLSVLRKGPDAVEERAAAVRRRDQARLEVTRLRSSLAASVDQTTSSSHRCPSCGQFMGEGHSCPTPEGLPAGDYSRLKGDDRVKEMLGDLETSVKAIVESGQLHRWLDAVSSNGLARWSANNRLLAAVQMLQRGQGLEGLHLMGFRQWEKFNRKVSKGAKAVWILAPITRRITEEDADGNQRETSRVVGFKGVPVFNISDTSGEPLASAPVKPAPGEATSGTLEGLRDRVVQAGYFYEEIEIPGCRPATGEGTLGYTDPKTKRIVVDSRLDGAQKASTIAHELGHVHAGHVDGDYEEYRRHRGRMETEAEMAAYMVNRSRGMSRDQSDSFSPGYIAGWSRGDAKVMRGAMDKAVKAYNKIMDGGWPK